MEKWPTFPRPLTDTISLETGFPCKLVIATLSTERLRTPDTFLLTEDRETTIWVCYGSQHFVHYSESDMALLVKGLNLEGEVFDKGSISIGHGFVQHAGAGRKADGALGYLYCLILEGTDLKDAVALAYGNSLHPRDRQFCPFIDIHENSSPDSLRDRYC